ncbi:uncharacterized protein [Watersipora subatra]|uniref:uncharacterized protein n=1 Tax=Watersipora subatra TaxID=2589382 RepID=UPI00355B169B
MLLIVSLATLGVLSCLAFIDGHVSHHKFSLAAVDMVVNADVLYQDCYVGNISHVTFHNKYAYGKFTTCKHNSDPIIPVEWTDSVEALLSYGEEASELYSPCIASHSCSQLDLRDWKEIALEQFVAGEYCEREESGDDSECLGWKTEANHTLVRQIIESMYLVIEYECSLDTRRMKLLIASVISNSRQNCSTVRIAANQWRCPASVSPYILHITEQAAAVRIKTLPTNRQLVKKIQQAVDEGGTGETRICIADDLWSIRGGYHSLLRTYPNSLQVYYDCSEKHR